MKKIILFLVFASLFSSCSSSSTNKSSIVELELSDSSNVNSKRATGMIASTGEVDRYHISLVETGRILQIKCTSNTTRPSVDLLINVFEMDANGNLQMIAGTHAPEGSIQSADLKINIYIDSPKELYINVRDLQDNESSENSYFLSAFYEAAPDGNGNFENAVTMTVGGEMQRDNIGKIGDIDCFSFDVTTTGVYDTAINFDPITGTSVRLTADLYSDDGTLIENRNTGSNSTTHMVHYLTPGSYKITVDDDGKDDFDPASFYTVGVSQTTPNEVNTNDIPTAALNGMIGDNFTGASIDYYEDIDWYKLAITASGDIDILELGFDSDTTINYRLNLYKITDTDVDSFLMVDEVPAFSHDFSSANDPAYSAMLKLDTLAAGETYYLAIMPQDKSTVTGNMPYTASVTITSITDPDEAGNGNDIDTNAIAHTTATGSDTGKIGYRSDVDWYKVTLPLSSTDRVLSIGLDIPSSNNVEYAIDIIRSAREGEGSSYSVSKTLRHTHNDYRNVDLETGIIVPEQSANAELFINNATYYIKVYDYQNDDGEDLNYTINWSTTNIPAAPDAITGVTSPVYNDEKNEMDGNHASDYRNSSDDVTMVYEDESSATFRVNSTMFNLKAPTGFTSTENGTVTTITTPWVSGYVDYQGDEDWYGVNLSDPYIDGDENWYYEIGVEMISAGSNVEYIWEYMPDSNNNNQVNAGACSADEWTPCNSTAAMDGDIHDDIDDDSDFSRVFPGTNDTTPWIGSRGDDYGWKGVVFFRVRDFNFLRTDTDTVNPNPDNDWGFDNPYFMRVVIKYHSGKACPTCD